MSISPPVPAPSTEAEQRRRAAAVKAELARLYPGDNGARLFAERFRIAQRTAERILAGTRPAPNALLDEIVAAIEADPVASLTERTVATALRGMTACRWPPRGIDGKLPRKEHR